MTDFKVKGFRAAAVAAGIKYKDRLDLGLIVSEKPAVPAAVFTKNIVKAAPVIAGIRQMQEPGCRLSAIVVNSGNANACTGADGMRAYEAICAETARLLEISPSEVAFSSTGVIGEPLPVNRFKDALPDAVANLSEDGFTAVSDAILTTDTVRKTSVKEVEIDGTKATIAGMAKGAGMIGPNMGPPQATMLCFIMTDASVERGWWQDILSKGADQSFNRITVDGDTSTNDTVYALANGMAGTPLLAAGHADAEKFASALAKLMKDLALQIVRDGEGATKCVSITVCGTENNEDAERIARTVAESPLVKTALFGQDPNWGRIFAAAGRAGVLFDPEAVRLSIGDVVIAEKGRGTGKEAEKRASAIMAGAEFAITLETGSGRGSATIYTCDFSDEYVHINADYRT